MQYVCPFLSRPTDDNPSPVYTPKERQDALMACKKSLGLANAVDGMSDRLI